MGLPVLFFVLFLAKNELWPGAGDGLPENHGPQMGQSGVSRLLSASGRSADIHLDPARSILESRLGRPDTRLAFREPAHELSLLHPTTYSRCGLYVARLKSQAEGYRERASDFYQLLIFPHHWFW